MTTESHGPTIELPLLPLLARVRSMAGTHRLNQDQLTVAEDSQLTSELPGGRTPIVHRSRGTGGFPALLLNEGGLGSMKHPKRANADTLHHEPRATLVSQLHDFGSWSSLNSNGREGGDRGR